jgi:hypothetical protein
MLNSTSSAKNQRIHTVFADIDDDNPSCGGDLAKLLKWYGFQKIFEV